VSQVSYQQAAPPCSTCSANSQPAPPQTFVAPPAAAPAATAPLQPTPAPGVTVTSPAAAPPAAEVKPDYNANRPPVETPPATPPAAPVQPEPGADPSVEDPYKVKKDDASTYLEAPKLFNPKDRTASRVMGATVRTAVYEQPTAYRQTSTAPRGPISDAQAQKDAIGWTSGAK